MNQRKIEALRKLAERPGTPEEGNIARKMLAEAERKAQAHAQSAPEEFVRGGSFFDFARWLDELAPKSGTQAVK